MGNRKGFSFVVLSLLIMLVLVGCKNENVSATVSLKIVVPAECEDIEDEVKLDMPVCRVIGTGGNPPTALQAVQEALQESNIPYELTADKTALASAFDLTEKMWHEGEKIYCTFWECSVNGAISSEGRQNKTIMNDGDEIIFTWKNESTIIDTDSAATKGIPSKTTAIKKT